MELNDVGTRYAHYRELLDLWEQGYEILAKRSEELNGFVSKELREVMHDLEGAIELMTKQLEIQSNIQFNMYKAANEVDKIAEGDKNA